MEMGGNGNGFMGMGGNGNRNSPSSTPLVWVDAAVAHASTSIQINPVFVASHLLQRLAVRGAWQKGSRMTDIRASLSALCVLWRFVQAFTAWFLPKYCSEFRMIRDEANRPRDTIASMYDGRVWVIDFYFVTLKSNKADSQFPRPINQSIRDF